MTLILALMLFSAVTAKAQYSNPQMQGADYRNMIQMGVKLGFNYSNVFDTQGDEFKADGKFGLATGVFAAIPIGSLFGFQPEILISMKGFQATGRYLGFTYDHTRTTTYIDIPLLVSFKPSPYFNLLAGPQYSYLIKQKDVFRGAGLSYEQETEFTNDNPRLNTLCFLSGFDIDISRIVISARAGWDLFKNNGDNTSTTPRYKNVWYQATLGYRLVND